MKTNRRERKAVKSRNYVKAQYYLSQWAARYSVYCAIELYKMTAKPYAYVNEWSSTKA